jgi:hypothetical protein
MDRSLPEPDRLLGHYLTLHEFCTCTQTYQRYSEQINPYPSNSQETIPALVSLNQHILDPVIHRFGRERFLLTYGFCSIDLQRWLNRKDPATGEKYGRVSPDRDQHMAHEIRRNGRYYCDRLGAACDFGIIGLPSDELVDWVLEHPLPFDSLYFYGRDRPIHISYGPQHKRSIWAFTASGLPTRQGIEAWLRQIQSP